MSQNIFDELRFKKHDEDFSPKREGAAKHTRRAKHG